MKYYFITYQASSTHNPEITTIWNDVINVSPMQFIKDMDEMESKSNGYYERFVILNALEISEAEYNEYVDQF